MNISPLKCSGICKLALLLALLLALSLARLSMTDKSYVYVYRYSIDTVSMQSAH